MQLGEALANRSAKSKKIAELRERIAATVTHTEDEAPIEDVNALLAEADQVAIELGVLIAQINRTNSRTIFGAGLTITDALAQRDTLSTQITTLEQAANAVSGRNAYLFRSRQSELKTIVDINVAEIRAAIDALQTQRRALDARLQQLGWEIDIIEES